MKAAETLQKLTQGPAKRKVAAQLREIFDQIEATSAAGIPLEKIWETLKAEGGIDITFSYFKNAIYRIRKERRNKGEEPQTHNPVEANKLPNIKLEPKPNQVSPVGGTDPQELIRQAEALMGESIREDLRDVLIKECEYQAGKGLSFDFEQIDDLCHLLKKKMTDARSLKSTLTFNYFKK